MQPSGWLEGIDTDLGTVGNQCALLLTIELNFDGTSPSCGSATTSSFSSTAIAHP